MFEHSLCNKPFQVGLVLLQSTAVLILMSGASTEVVDRDKQLENVVSELGNIPLYGHMLLQETFSYRGDGTLRSWVSLFWEKLLTQTLKGLETQRVKAEGGKEPGMSQKKRHFYCPILGHICRVIC